MSAFIDIDEITQCSVHQPSAFMLMHQAELLPTWRHSIASVIIVLQRCSTSLAQHTPETERQKDWLRDRFFSIGEQIVEGLHRCHYRCEIFDPRTGWPLRSPRGTLKLDDVAVVRESLDYAVRQQGQCATLIHPQWGDAVYPASLVSVAPSRAAIQNCQHVSTTASTNASTTVSTT